MTRRDRLLRIIDNFGGVGPYGHPSAKHGFQRTLAKHGLSLFTDEAIELIVREIVRDWKRTKRMNRENRARRSA